MTRPTPEQARDMAERLDAHAYSSDVLGGGDMIAEAAAMLRAYADADQIAIIDQWLHTPTLLLRAGELTGQEVRTVKAVLNAIRREMGGDAAAVCAPAALGLGKC